MRLHPSAWFSEHKHEFSNSSDDSNKIANINDDADTKYMIVKNK